MPTSHPCETAALRIHWAARLLGSEDGESRPRIDGTQWEDVLHEIGRSTSPRAFQGSRQWKLFDSYGGSGLNVEFDMALDYGGQGRLFVLVEAKAVADRCLSRDHVLVFSGKIKDHLQSPQRAFGDAHALIASAGRVEPSFCCWCFYEGIDITDPDRFPIGVLCRLPAILPGPFARLPEPQLHERLLDLVCIEDDDPEAGPVFLRKEGSPKLLRGKRVLSELCAIQAKLSDDLFTTLRASMPMADEAAQESALFERIRWQFTERGIRLPSPDPPR